MNKLTDLEIARVMWHCKMSFVLKTLLRHSPPFTEGTQHQQQSQLPLYELDVSDSANFNSLSAALALHPSSWGFSGSGAGSDPFLLAETNRKVENESERFDKPL